MKVKLIGSAYLYCFLSWSCKCVHKQKISNSGHFKHNSVKSNRFTLEGSLTVMWMFFSASTHSGETMSTTDLQDKHKNIKHYSYCRYNKLQRANWQVKKRHLIQLEQEEMSTLTNIKILYIVLTSDHLAMIITTSQSELRTPLLH